nr:hypothetical protein [uncultured bacterium]
MVGLPALDIFHSRAQAQVEPPRVYSAMMLQQNGAVQGEDEPDMFWPRELGSISAEAMTGIDADRATSELADYAAELNFVRGLDFHYSANHSGGPVAAGTAAPVVGLTTENQMPVAESADYFIASHMTPGRDPLTLYAGRKGTFRDDAFSFGPGGTLRIGDNNPWNVYQRLMGLGGLDPAIVERIASRRQSVNDLIRDEVEALLRRSDLSGEDRRRMDLHLSSIRDMETTVTGVVGPELDGAAMRAFDEDPTASASFEAVVRAQLDIIAFAFAADLARTATLQVGSCSDQTRYVINGQEAPPYHFVSHRVMSDVTNGDPIPNAEELHHEIDRIHARFFKHLLDKLSAYTLPEGGTLLDSSVNLWVNSISNGPGHSGSNIPHVLAGSARGFLKTGLHIRAKGYTSKVLSTIISACGVRKADGSLIDDFNDPDGVGLLDELIA